VSLVIIRFTSETNISKIAEQKVKIVDTDSSNVGASVTQRGAKGAQSVEIVDSAGNQIPLASGLVPEAYDEINISYSGDDISTVIYKNGGVTVATLTLSYLAGKLTTIVKT